MHIAEAGHPGRAYTGKMISATQTPNHLTPLTVFSCSICLQPPSSPPSWPLPSSSLSLLSRPQLSPLPHISCAVVSPDPRYDVLERSAVRRILALLLLTIHPTETLCPCSARPQVTQYKWKRLRLRTQNVAQSTPTIRYAHGIVIIQHHAHSLAQRKAFARLRWTCYGPLRLACMKSESLRYVFSRFITWQD